MSRKSNSTAGLRFHGSMLLGVSVVIALLAIPSALASEKSAQPVPDTAAPAASAVPPVVAPPVGVMVVYTPKKPVDKSTLVPFPPPEVLGGEVLTGNPKLFGRIDFQQGNMLGGLFMATTGLIRVTFPFTEHATILEGEVTLTDETGKSHKYKAGDSYFIRQGSVILWDVKGKYVIKSFFNVTEPVAP
jgi:uncharacterized cupin superfamily protein